LENVVDFDNFLRACKNTGPIGENDYLLGPVVIHAWGGIKKNYKYFLIIFTEISPTEICWSNGEFNQFRNKRLIRLDLSEKEGAEEIKRKRERR
jgi:hypothetical protein